MLKKFNSFLLSFLLITAMIHVDVDHHDHGDVYSICNINCDSSEHHFSIHECGICLIKKNKIIVQQPAKYSYNKNQIDLFCIFQEHYNIFSNVTIHSRAPPKIL